MNTRVFLFACALGVSACAAIIGLDDRPDNSDGIPGGDDDASPNNDGSTGGDGAIDGSLPDANGPLLDLTFGDGGALIIETGLADIAALDAGVVWLFGGNVNPEAQFIVSDFDGRNASAPVSAPFPMQFQNLTERPSVLTPVDGTYVAYGSTLVSNTGQLSYHAASFDKSRGSSSNFLVEIDGGTDDAKGIVDDVHQAAVGGELFGAVTRERVGQQKAVYVFSTHLPTAQLLEPSAYGGSTLSGTQDTSNPVAYFSWINLPSTGVGVQRYRYKAAADPMPAELTPDPGWDRNFTTLSGGIKSARLVGVLPPGETPPRPFLVGMSGDLNGQAPSMFVVTFDAVGAPKPVASFDVPKGYSQYAITRAMAIGTQILVGGCIDNRAWTARLVFDTMTSKTTYDPTFGNAGQAWLERGPRDECVRGMAVDPKGHAILLIGTTPTDADAGYDAPAKLVRLAR